MSENDLKKLTMVLPNLYFGDNCSYCNISDISNYVTLK